MWNEAITRIQFFALSPGRLPDLRVALVCGGVRSLGLVAVMTTDEKRVYERARYHANLEVRRAIAQRKSKGKRLWIPNDPKMRARSLLRAAVRTGKVIKPSRCEECGEEVVRHRLHGHHNDYSKPFDVQWICSTCHGVHSRK